MSYSHVGREHESSYDGRSLVDITKDRLAGFAATTPTII